MRLQSWAWELDTGIKTTNTATKLHVYFVYLCRTFYMDQPGSRPFSGSQDLGFLSSAQLPQTCLGSAGGSPLISWMNVQGPYLEKELFIGSSGGPVFLV